MAEVDAGYTIVHAGQDNTNVRTHVTDVAIDVDGPWLIVRQGDGRPLMVFPESSVRYVIAGRLGDASGQTTEVRGPDTPTRRTGG